MDGEQDTLELSFVMPTDQRAKVDDRWRFATVLLQWHWIFFVCYQDGGVTVQCTVGVPSSLLWPIKIARSASGDVAPKYPREAYGEKIRGKKRYACHAICSSTSRAGSCLTFCPRRSQTATIEMCK